MVLMKMNGGVVDENDCNDDPCGVDDLDGVNGGGF